nr:Chain K, Peptide LEU-ILE-LEU-ARG-TRP-GLU-GLN-ASP [Trichoplusia ni]5IUE_L Chain L, Peptide LEU-ILE-LEU-ARG-TRP-GLU-GLN-ASP [Trichoplusia ni]5IUE_M Chain M, Peptide LEU-ILE-LEU-ARG-TRP-GLU-GLN-ASP [Trichoplusia ni]5IUE_N Chain N, Peptide LEU-ILE-LEU-ARG-TRP-GLU-GLN-ASP [Trichoplusia ni]
LILRWEQD